MFAITQKRLCILCFSTTSIKIWRSGAFFAFSLFIHLSEPLRKQKVVVRDLWLVDFDPFCVFLCFKVRCFVFEKHRKFYLSSKIFFIFFTLKHGKFRFQRWNCSYRASKSRGNTDNTATEGWKRTGTFPLTFTFADKHSGCYGNGLIDVAEKFEFGACSIWIVEDVGRGSRQISEGVTHLGLPARWITHSSICLILHILRKPNSLIAK